MATDYKNIKPTRDYHTFWLSNNNTPPDGTLCVTYNRGIAKNTDEVLIVEYFLGDGKSTYKQLVDNDKLFGYYKVAPHTDTDGNYGIGSNTKFGHIRMSDAIPAKATVEGNAGTDNGYAAHANHQHPSELPSQTDQAGKYLMTDGTSPKWSTVGNLLTVNSTTNGKFLSNNGTNPEWVNLIQIPSLIGQSGKILGTDGASVYWTSYATNYNLTLKNTSGNNVVYNGTSAVDLSAGVYHSANSDFATNCTNATKVSTAETSTNGVFYLTSSTGSGSRQLYFNGNLKFNPSTGVLISTKVYNAVYNDYAEYFPRGEKTEAGDIIMLDMNSKEEKYIKAIHGKGRVVGVHSDSYGHIIGGEMPLDRIDFEEYNNEKYIPVGLSGRCLVKVMGTVKKGDYIVPSDKAGVGRAFDKELDEKDDIIGFAVESDNKKSVRKLKVKLI